MIYNNIYGSIIRNIYGRKCTEYLLLDYGILLLDYGILADNFFPAIYFSLV